MHPSYKRATARCLANGTSWESSSVWGWERCPIPRPPRPPEFSLSLLVRHDRATISALTSSIGAFSFFGLISITSYNIDPGRCRTGYTPHSSRSPRSAKTDTEQAVPRSNNPSSASSSKRCTTGRRNMTLFICVWACDTPINEHLSACQGGTKQKLFNKNSQTTRKKEKKKKDKRQKKKGKRN